MQFVDVWPFLIPAIIFQVIMQIYCIVEGIKENNKPVARVVYIVSIAIFGLFAIAFHLLSSKKKPPKETMIDDVERVNYFTKKGIFILLLIAYQVMGLHLLAENVGTTEYSALLWLLTGSFLCMLLYNMLPKNKWFFTEPALPILQLLLCIPIQYLDGSGDNLFLSIIAGFSAINYSSLTHAKVYGIGAFGTYLIGSTISTINLTIAFEISDIVRYFFVNTLVVMLALIAFYTLKKQLITSIQLEFALNTVKEQSEKIKRLAVVEERNRIASDMHDIVGHTLTVAVLRLEAGKIEQGTEQVRRGLSELRASVRVVREGNELDFAKTLNQLLHEIHIDTGLIVRSVIESPILLPPLQAGIALSAIKECVTNAIKHGRASEADILISTMNNELRLTFTDNGMGADNMKFGSGLSIMRERIKSVGGSLEVESAPGDGFTVNLLIPIVQIKEEMK